MHAMILSQSQLSLIIEVGLVLVQDIVGNRMMPTVRTQRKGATLLAYASKKVAVPALLLSLPIFASVRTFMDRTTPFFCQVRHCV